MQQFNLDKWLKDKSRKVVTREGKDVEIIHTNSPVPHHPIVGFIGKSIYTWTIDGKLIYGKKEQDQNDIFLADDEEELTEFEQKLVEVLKSEGAPIGYLENFTGKDKEVIHCYSKQLLDMAIKEPMLEISDFEIYDKGFKEGKKYAVKDVPKWKKYKGKLIGNGLSFEDNVNLVLVRNGYYIDINELDKLPKEE